MKQLLMRLYSIYVLVFGKKMDRFNTLKLDG